MYNIGEIIKYLRTKKRLSMEELAEKVNSEYGTSINKGMISKWENGLGEPRLDNVRQLALFFDVSLDYLIGIDVSLEDIPLELLHHYQEQGMSETEMKIAYRHFEEAKRLDAMKDLYDPKTIAAHHDGEEWTEEELEEIEAFKQFVKSKRKE